MLITGAGGFVGSHLAAGFRDLGYRVTAVDASFDAVTRARLAGVELHEARLAAGALDACPATDVVVHAAALTSSPQELGLSAAAHMQANLDAMLATLDWASRTGARMFVFVSSSGVFTPEDAAELLLESVPASGTGAYALAKRAGEMIAAGSASATLSVLVVRLGYIYGPYEAARASRANVSLVRQWLDAAQAGRAVVTRTPETRRDWTYARDLAPALDRLLRDGTAGLVHLGSGAISTDLEVALAVADAVHVPVEIAPASDAVRAKAPMGRERGRGLDGMQWTPLSRGIGEIISLETAA